MNTSDSGGESQIPYQPTNQNKKLESVLYVMQLPPPVHGSNLMNKYVFESPLLNNSFKTSLVNLRFSRSSGDIERFTLRKFFLVPYYAFWMVQKVLTQNYDLVYMSMAPRGFAFYRDALYIILMKVLRQNIIIHLHGKGFTMIANDNPVYRQICRFVFKDVYTISLSDKLTEDVRQFVNRDSMVIPNGISQPNGPHPPVKKISKVPQILFLSNYLRGKGILVLIDALSILDNQGNDFRARLVGAPADLSLAFVNEYIRSKKLTKKVIAVGPRYDEGKTLEFEQADIFVFPTFYKNEAFPLVNLEAMQNSLPIISTNEGGIADMLKNANAGFIVEPRNSETLAEKIGDLIKDESLRKEMGRNAFVHFQNNYTLDKFEHNLKKTFEDLILIKNQKTYRSRHTETSITSL